MSISDYTCGNCDHVYQIDTDGEPIQPCPECGSNEMVKAPNKDDNRKK